MFKLLKRFLREEDGQDFAEYALILGAIGVVAIAIIVEVEVDTTQGFPGVDLVGLPDTAVKVSAARVQTAICNAGLPYPRERIVVNLAPAVPPATNRP